MTCSCDLCKLAAVNLQISDLRVIIKKLEDENGPAVWRVGHRTMDVSNIADDVKCLILKCVHRCVLNKEHRVGRTFNCKAHNYEMCIYRVNDTTFDFSFYTTVEPVPEEEVDPLPMD